jgi:hypothetical protein
MHLITRIELIYNRKVYLQKQLYLSNKRLAQMLEWYWFLTYLMLKQPSLVTSADHKYLILQTCGCALEIKQETTICDK